MVGRPGGRDARMYALFGYIRNIASGGRVLVVGRI